MRLMKAMGVAGILALAGCASLQSVSMTQVPADRSGKVEAEASSWGFLGIFFSNEFADQAVSKLRDACPNGRLTGVYTKHENRFYVLTVKRSVRATAYCQPVGKGT
jgi:hypothetical protein